MRIFSEKECHAWASEKLGEPFTWLSVERGYRHCAMYLIPSDAGRKTALARALSSLLNSSAEGLLWITGWGIFPSSENMALFDAYRRSLSEDRALRAAPGHVFEHRDVREVECLLDLVLYFSWDASVIDAGSSCLRMSHDEVLTVRCQDPAALRSWQESIAEFDLEQLSTRT